jgi:hypothetical protein
MTTYKCELIDKGIVKERFYRDGGSVSELFEDLSNWSFPDGDWRITKIDNEESK